MRGLTLAAFALRVSLTDFVARVALANHIDSASATNDLAISMSVLEGTNRRNDFHCNNLQTSVLPMGTERGGLFPRAHQYIDEGNPGNSKKAGFSSDLGPLGGEIRSSRAKSEGTATGWSVCFQDPTTGKDSLAIARGCASGSLPFFHGLTRASLAL